MRLTLCCSLAILFCLLFAVPANTAQTQNTGAVISIIDGDTFSVLTKEKQQVTLRLYGIDCPARGREFWPRSKQATTDAVLGKIVTYQPVDTDSDGRIVAVVLMPGGRSLNEHLIRLGLAWVNEKTCTKEDICAPLVRLEKAAKLQHSGMWEEKTPVAQQDWMLLPGSGGPTVPGNMAPR